MTAETSTTLVILDIIDRRDLLIEEMFAAHLRCGDVTAAEMVEFRKAGVRIGEA